MLIIRSEQMEVFNRIAFDQFVAATEAHLHSSYPNAAKRHALEMADIIRRGIETARTYDITTEDDVRGFLECILIFGERLDQDSKRRWAADILHDDSIGPDEKVRRLRTYPPQPLMDIE